MSRQYQIALLSLVVLLAVQTIGAFQTSSRSPWQPSLLGKGPNGQRSSLTECASTRAQPSEKVDEVNFLMKQFTTSSGEIVNPYKILKVPRKAERKEIREAYRSLSKKFHPDIVRHSKYLPGNCKNHDDVEAHWERIQISYNILSEKKTRMQYDRHEMIHDPGAAMQRAMLGAAVSSVMGIGKGIFHVGASTLDMVMGGEKKQDEEEEHQNH